MGRDPKRQNHLSQKQVCQWFWSLELNLSQGEGGNEEFRLSSDSKHVRCTRDTGVRCETSGKEHGDD